MRLRIWKKALSVSLSTLALIGLDTATEHEKEIRVVKFVEELGMVVTCSDDRFTNFWVPPRSWRVEESTAKDEEPEDEIRQKKKGDDSSDDGYGMMADGAEQN